MRLEQLITPFLQRSEEEQIAHIRFIKKDRRIYKIPPTKPKMKRERKQTGNPVDRLTNILKTQFSNEERVALIKRLKNAKV